MTLGPILMAGEEISRGRWILNGHSPEVMLELNTQHGTKLRNTSAWLN